MSLRLLKQVASLEPPVHLMGGWAEDILLSGSISEGHRDLDLLVCADRLSAAAEQLVAVGLAWEPLEDQPGSPWRFREGKDVPVEVWPCVTSADGFLLVIPGTQGQRFRLRLPADTFNTPATTVQGITVHTVSPIALYLLRSASALTRHDGERRECDLEMMKQLRNSLLRNRSDSDFTLALEEFDFD